MNKIRTFILAAMAAAALLAIQPEAKATCVGYSFSPSPFAFETLTVSTVSLAFTSATYAPAGAPAANVALVTLETNPIRFRNDGTAPTASIGHLVSPGQSVEVCGILAVSQMRMIRQGAADGTVMITYLR